MARWYGAIGFAETKETAPGVWTEQICERNYYGDLIRNTSHRTAGSTVLQGLPTTNDDINISNSISVLCDPFGFQNFMHIKYVTFMGAKWKVNDVSVEFPRLTLTIGGLYDGQNAY